MSANEKLVERLIGCVPFDAGDSRIIQEAAAALATLTEERDALSSLAGAAMAERDKAKAALTAAETRVKVLEEALAGVMPLTSYGPEGKSPPDELAAIAAGYAALGFCPDCGAGPKDKCRYNAMGQSCREVLRYRPRQALTHGASDE